MYYGYTLKLSAKKFGENALHCEACHKLALKKERLKSLALKKEEIFEELKEELRHGI